MFSLGVTWHFVKDSTTFKKFVSVDDHLDINWRRCWLLALWSWYKCDEFLPSGVSLCTVKEDNQTTNKWFSLL